MKLMIIGVCITFLICGCSLRQPTLRDSNYLVGVQLPSATGEPKLILTAEPRSGFGPLRVTFQATLQNVPADTSKFNCLWEEWNFGDGAVSAERHDCGTFSQTEFWTEHLYDSTGAFSVRFKLGDQIIQSNTITVRVFSRGDMDRALSVVH